VGNKKRVAIGLVLGLLSVVLLNFYLSSVEKRFKVTGKTGTVYVAKKYIPANTVVTSQLVEPRVVPLQFVQPGALKPGVTLKTLAGRDVYITAVPIAKSEQVVYTKLVMGNIKTGLAAYIPVGYRAVTVPVDEVSSVANLIRPGDWVDIYASIDYAQNGLSRGKEVLMFQKVRVIAVGKRFGIGNNNDTNLEGYGTVTFAMTPVDAARIAYTHTRAVLTLVLRSNADDEVVEVPEVTMLSLLTENNAELIQPVKSKVPIFLRGMEKQLETQLGK